MNTKVLIADDDPTIRFMVKSILEAEGYSVTAAEDGKQAVDILADNSFVNNLAFIVLDVMMPGMTGLDILTRLKLNPKTSSLPVIMLTGKIKTAILWLDMSKGPIII